MGIRFVCESCNRKLHVKAFLAGKRGICPHCDARVRIPETVDSSTPTQLTDQLAANGAVTPELGSALASEAESVAVAPNAHDLNANEGSVGQVQAIGPPALPASQNSLGVEEVDPINEAPAAKWYVRPPSGGQFGPASGEILRSWIREGRVTADSLVWREGWEDWVAAEARFSSLSTHPQLPANVPVWEGPQTESATPQQNGDRLPTRTRRQQSRSSASAIFVTLLLITLVLLGILVVVLMNS
ncbi:MAG: DUF4339 domain-containing protein [Planctomycetota bacterium]|nr:DUF4339 domain-containing protein [Planctomycetota bacterium]